MKRVHLMTTAIVCFLSVAMQAQFSGPGTYRVVSYDNQEYIGYAYADDDNKIFMQKKAKKNTVFKIIANGDNYNIVTEDGAKILTRTTGTKVFTRPNTSKNQKDLDCIFSIEEADVRMTYNDKKTAAPYLSGRTYLFTNIPGEHASVDKPSVLGSLKAHAADKSIRASKSTIASFVKWYLIQQ